MDERGRRRAEGNPADQARWNHNIHYHAVLIDALPDGARCVLDVGCGEGHLTRQLRQRLPEVVGIDVDPSSIAFARRHPDAKHIDYVVGNVFDHPFEPASFDTVVTVATLHHIDAQDGIRRMIALLKPGGVLGIIGLAAFSPRDLPYDAAGLIWTHILRRRRSWYEPRSPIKWPPLETFTSMRRIVTRLMPGARYRRRVLWRYSVIWYKPEI